MRGVGNWLALAVLIRVPAEIGYGHSHPGTCMCLRVLFFFLIFHFSFFSGYKMEYLCHGSTNFWSPPGAVWLALCKSIAVIRKNSLFCIRHASIQQHKGETLNRSHPYPLCTQDNLRGPSLPAARVSTQPVYDACTPLDPRSVALITAQQIA